MRILLILLSLTLSTFLWCQKVEPKFKCEKKLKDQYGMCAHFTFTDKKADNKTMKDQARMLHELGCNFIRSDLTYYMVNKSNTAILDKVLAVLAKNRLSFLGIAADPRFSESKWHDDNKYNQLLTNVQNYYLNNIDYLEFQNEVNFSKVPNLGLNYTNDLKKLYSLKQHKRSLKILFSGIADTNYAFLDSVMQYNGNRYFDIMNFHTYRSPEDIPVAMEKIDNNMRKYHWSKPVWMTECGMHTAKYDTTKTDYAFFTKVVPQALKQIGYEIKGLNVGIIYDADKGYYSLNDYEIKSYILNKGANTKYITLSDISTLSPKSVPVVILAPSEKFYGEYFPSIIKYVRDGGTLILSYGTPFYYDLSNGEKNVGKYFANQLHIGQLYYWDNDAKKEKAPQAPTYYKANDSFGESYSFYKPGDGMTPRYLTSSLLKGSDKMTPITFAGDSNYKGVVAALYQFDSDLRGNIIIQTRMGTLRLVNLEDEQARRVARIHLIAFAYGVDKVFWYKFRSNELDPYYSEDNFGMVHADLSPKPAYYAYNTLIKMLPNGSTRPLLTIKDGIYKAEWKRPDGKKITAYWCKEGFTYMNLNPNPVMIIDYMGKEMTLNGKTIKIHSGVTYTISKK